VHDAHPELVENTFGDNSAELLHLLSADCEFQEKWADEHTLEHGALAEPWKSMFAAFGSLPEVQAEQLKHVREDYLVPAIRTAMKLGFTSELGLALCFDIHVQNGGIKAAVLKKILQQVGIAEPKLRTLTANAVADSARAAFREDVRRRKLTIATGE